MLKLSDYIRAYVVVAILLSSCSIYKSVPGPAEFQSDVHGSFADVHVPASDVILYGELIAIDRDTLYLLSDTIMLTFATATVDNVKVYVAARSDHKNWYTTWAILLTITTPGTFGLWSIFALPLHLILLLPVMISAPGNFVISYPSGIPGEVINWTDLRKFTRFPQGIPPGVATSDIH